MMTEILSENRPCKSCAMDAMQMDPYSIRSNCQNCRKLAEWSEKCMEKLKKYETADAEGRLIWNE